MHSSQFDGAAAFSGGGFMPSQATQGPKSSFSYSKNHDPQSLLTLTVKQINDAFLLSDDKSNMIIDSVDVKNVTLVGRVCNKAGRITDVTFVLDDGTGRIECSKWLQEYVDTNEAKGIRIRKRHMCKHHLTLGSEMVYKGWIVCALTWTLERLSGKKDLKCILF